MHWCTTEHGCLWQTRFYFSGKKVHVTLLEFSCSFFFLMVKFMLSMHWLSPVMVWCPRSKRHCLNQSVEKKKKKSMLTLSNGNICRVTGHLCGEFTGNRWIPAQRPVTWSFDVFIDLCLNKQLSKQWWGWWFEMPLCPLWRHYNVIYHQEPPWIISIQYITYLIFYIYYQIILTQRNTTLIW